MVYYTNLTTLGDSLHEPYMIPHSGTKRPLHWAVVSSTTLGHYLLGSESPPPCRKSPPIKPGRRGTPARWMMLLTALESHFLRHPGPSSPTRTQALRRFLNVYVKTARTFAFSSHQATALMMCEIGALRSGGGRRPENLQVQWRIESPRVSGPELVTPRAFVIGLIAIVAGRHDPTASPPYQYSRSHFQASTDVEPGQSSRSVRLPPKACQSVSPRADLGRSLKALGH